MISLAIVWSHMVIHDSMDSKCCISEDVFRMRILIENAIVIDIIYTRLVPNVTYDTQFSWNNQLGDMIWIATVTGH